MFSLDNFEANSIEILKYSLVFGLLHDEVDIFLDFMGNKE